MSDNMMNNDDMVFQKESNGSVYTGNYKINNIFKSDGIGPYSYIQHGGTSEILMNSIFKNLAVPTSLFFLQQNYSNHTNNKRSTVGDDISLIKDDLYTKLVDLVSVNRKTKQKKTRKHKKQANKKSRKRR